MFRRASEGFGGNWSHIVERAIGRNVSQYKDVIEAVFLSLGKKMKARKMPNGLWYRRVYKGSTTICYICGQGNHPSSILAPHMTPKGTQV